MTSQSLPTVGFQDESSVRREVTVQYEDLLHEQARVPDKIFIGGHTLKAVDPNLVFLDEDHGEHPRMWSSAKKIQTTALVAAFCFLSPFASTIFAPSVHLVMADLGIIDSTLGALQVSIFLFAFAVGPLVLAPLSELYGRSIILHTGNLIFAVFSIGGGFAQNTTQLALCRFFAGLGGSSGIAVVGGVVADIWDLAARPKASGLIMLGPVLGPILGPVCGGWMSERASWRWTLWVPAIAAGALGVVALLLLQESEGVYCVLDLKTNPAGPGFLLGQFVRPLIYLVVDPALFLASFFYSVCFGIAYLVLVTFADVFGLGYGQSVGIVGTDFLSMGVGMIIGTFGTIRVMEKVFSRGGQDGEKKFKPESRFLSCAPGILIAAGGLFLYGFSALKVHFMVPLVGIALYSCGVMNIMMAIQLYSIDGFQFPASAFATISFLRCLFGGAFPLFGSKLFTAIGVNWGIGMLAFLTLGVGLILLPVMYAYGEQLREIGVSNMAALEGVAFKTTDK